MPTYQYACTETSCGHRFEAVQSFTDPTLTACPVCSGNVRKVFSSVGVVFKGSGFYRTDSRGPEKKSTSEKSSTEKSSTESKKSDSGTSGGSDSTTSNSSGSTSSGSNSSGSGSSSGSSGGSSTAKAAAP